MAGTQEQIIECTGACTVTVVHQIQFLPSLSIDDGMLISSAILSLWFLAYMFRPIGKMISQ